MIPEGKYKARPTSWGLSESKNGAEQFAIGFEIVDGSEAGSTITWYGSFANDQAVDITIKGIKACGWTGSDLSSVELPGTEVELVIVHDEYPKGSGKVSAKVKFINGLGGGFKSMDQNKSKAFALKMQQRIKAFDAKNGTGTSSSPKPSTNGKPPAAYQRQPGDDFDDPSFP